MSEEESKNLGEKEDKINQLDEKIDKLIINVDQLSDLIANLDTKITNYLPKPKVFQQEPPSARWFALGVTMLAGFLASVQSTSLIVTLTTLATDLNAEFITIMWVLLAFNVSIAAMCPMLGFFADSGVKGSRCIMFNLGFFIFGFGSLLCGFAQTSNGGIDLVIYRSIMGAGAAFIFNNSSPILADKFFPYNQVGLAQGLWFMSFSFGSVVGPVIGGGLLNALGWKWIFFAQVPVCAIGCLVGLRKVQDTPQIEKPGEFSPKLSDVIVHFDFFGSFLFCTAVICFFIGITSSIFPSPGLEGDGPIGSLLGVSCFLTLVFIAWEWHIQKRSPLMDFSLFKIKDYALICLGAIEVAVCRGALTFGFIFYFQGAIGQDPLTAGISVIPQGLGTLIAASVAGRLTDKFGYRNLCMLGSLICAVGCLGACFLDQYTNYWGTAATLIVAGVGGGIYQSPSSSLGVMSVPRTRRGQSNATRMMITQISSMISIVICFKLIVGSLPPEVAHVLFLDGGKFLTADQINTFVKGFQSVMWICFALQVALIFLSSPLTKDVIKAPTAAPTPLAKVINNNNISSISNVNVLENDKGKNSVMEMKSIEIKSI